MSDEEKRVPGPDGEPARAEEPPQTRCVEFSVYETIGLADIGRIGGLDRRLRRRDDAARYYGPRGADYQPPSEGAGYTSIDVLPFLIGMEFDDLAMAWIHSLRPSRVRVITHNGCLTLDACHWRVTVHLDGRERIARVSQEVAVGYASGRNITELTNARKEGREPGPAPGAIGNAAGLERIDFD